MLSRPSSELDDDDAIDIVDVVARTLARTSAVLYENSSPPYRLNLSNGNCTRWSDRDEASTTAPSRRERAARGARRYLEEDAAVLVLLAASNATDCLRHGLDGA